MTYSLHQSVLLSETIDALSLTSSDVVVDATLGGAGHFKTILPHLSSRGVIIGIDADKQAVERARKESVHTHARVELVEDNFRNLDSILDNLGISEITKAVFDLGWSGYQLEAGRGLSFQKDEPLSMRYDDNKDGLTASDIVNTLPEVDIANIIFAYGEERFAKSIARAIVSTRESEPIQTTCQLVSVIKKATPAWYHHRKLHPATKTFQALRIAVNDEFDALREGLKSALFRLAPGGRIAVISFHSLEDRIVKQVFRQAVHEGTLSFVNKHPITASAVEILQNPRARSAKLRVCEKVSVPAKETIISYQNTYV